MKLVRRVPRTSPLHMDLQGFPWCSILVTCARREERRTISTGVSKRGPGELCDANERQIRHRDVPGSISLGFLVLALPGER